MNTSPYEYVKCSPSPYSPFRIRSCRSRRNPPSTVNGKTYTSPQNPIKMETTKTERDEKDVRASSREGGYNNKKGGGGEMKRNYETARKGNATAVTVFIETIGYRQRTLWKPHASKNLTPKHLRSSNSSTRGTSCTRLKYIAYTNQTNSATKNNGYILPTNVSETL